MIRQIELINFMSHRHTVIEPAKGLTVIIGDNNTGKSALVSALQVLCRNAPGDYMVSHGERECIVRVVTEEGDDIQWRRKGRAVSYVINGTEIHRLAGGVPEDLHKKLRLGLVETENDPFEIHFGEQKKPIFLLNESAARRATFFASSSDTIKLIEMQNLHRRNVQEAKTRESELVRREMELDARLEKLAPIDGLGCRIDKACALHRDISDNIEAAYGLAATIGRFEKANDAVSMHAAMADAAAGLNAPPSFFPVDALSQLIGRIEHAHGAIRVEHRRQTVLIAADPPPDLFDTAGVGGLIDRIGALEMHADRCRAEIAPCRRLVPVPAMADISLLRALVRRVGQALKDAEHFRGSAAVLTRLALPPLMIDASWLRVHIEKMASALETCEKRQADLQRIHQEIDAAGETLERFIEKEGICPTCGQEMDPAHFIGMTPLVAGRKQ